MYRWHIWTNHKHEFRVSPKLGCHYDIHVHTKRVDILPLNRLKRSLFEGRSGQQIERKELCHRCPLLLQHTMRWISCTSQLTSYHCRIMYTALVKFITCQVVSWFERHESPEECNSTRKSRLTTYVLFACSCPHIGLDVQHTELMSMFSINICCIIIYCIYC